MTRDIFGVNVTKALQTSIDNRIGRRTDGLIDVNGIEPVTDLQADVGRPTKRMRSGHFRDLTVVAGIVSTQTDFSEQSLVTKGHVTTLLEPTIQRTRHMTSNNNETFLNSSVYIEDVNEVYIRTMESLFLESDQVIITGRIVRINGRDLSQEITTLQSQLQQIRLKTPVMYHTQFPRVPLTNRNRISSSSSTDDLSFSSHQLFDGIFGETVTNQTNSGYLSNAWISEFPLSVDAEDGSFRANGWLNINGYGLVNGEWAYIDLQPDSNSVIMTSFQLYAPELIWPTQFRIVGSNDVSGPWTELYSASEAMIAGTYNHAGTGIFGAFTLETELTKKDTYFRYVGIFVSQHRDPSNRVVLQELILRGVE
jgi:hypothetical protein